MNVALIIGVSEYKNLVDLPACANDVSNMDTLLRATEKYDDILTIKSRTESKIVQECLMTFFESKRDEVIEEFFFYFSGHGTFLDDDTLFCLSDYQSLMPNSTSLSNSSLDNLIRNLNPQLTVKILDSCSSGTPYIKDASCYQGFGAPTANKGFKYFIEMSSSHQKQSSYTDNDIGSVFTMAWIDAVISSKVDKIYYSNIQSYVADIFSENNMQVPYFVNQGRGTEVFANLNEAVRLFEPIGKGKRQDESGDATQQDLIDKFENRIAVLDTKKVTKEEAFRILGEIRGSVVTEIEDKFIDNFYELSVVDLQFQDVVDVRELAILAERVAKDYMIKINYEEYKVKEFATSFNDMLASRNGYKEVIRKRPIGVSSMYDLPIEAVKFELKPKNHISLDTFVEYIVVFPGIMDFIAAFSTVRITINNWEVGTPYILGKWGIDNYTWSNESRNRLLILREEKLFEIARKHIEELAGYSSGLLGE